MIFNSIPSCTDPVLFFRLLKVDSGTYFLRLHGSHGFSSLEVSPDFADVNQLSACQVEVAVRDNAQRLYAFKLKSVGRGKCSILQHL